MSLEFRFDEQGQNVSVFPPDPFYDDGKQPPVARAWEARNSTFGVHHGVTVATAAVAEWQLPEGLFAYWRGRPVRVDYRVSPPGAGQKSRAEYVGQDVTARHRGAHETDADAEAGATRNCCR